MDDKNDSDLKKTAYRIRTDPAEAARIGQELAGLLQLRKSKTSRGRFNTAWGTKTTEGLAKTVLQFLEETCQ